VADNTSSAARGAVLKVTVKKYRQYMCVPAPAYPRRSRRAFANRATPPRPLPFPQEHKRGPAGKGEEQVTKTRGCFKRYLLRHNLKQNCRPRMGKKRSVCVFSGRFWAWCVCVCVCVRVRRKGVRHRRAGRAA
jgi:hypothetical protein